MGTWGTGSFENDDAADWVWQLETATGCELVQNLLTEFNQLTGYLQATDCQLAVAAAEVVAALVGHPAGELPEEVSEYVSRVKEHATGELRKVADLAVQRVQENSELRELWGVSDSNAEWLSVIESLRARLQGQAMIQ